MKRFLMALTLASVLSVSALAGEVPCGDFVPPPPPPSASSLATASGETADSGFATTLQGSDLVNISATEAALNLLQSVLSLI